MEKNENCSSTYIGCRIGQPRNSFPSVLSVVSLPKKIGDARILRF
jgi:hypothetical protein